jgi:hypothetical protein
MNTKDERNVNPIAEMSRISQEIMALSSRGFKESFRSTQSATIIYDSEWCRIKIIWGGWEYGSGNTMHIVYGRLHALNDDTTMLWKGEECYCWHDLDYVLHFLDGCTVIKAAELNYSHPLTDPFYKKELRSQYESQPVWIAHIHLAIWQRYGQSLFDLFDLRQPEHWEQYRKFLREVYDIVGRIPEIEPPLDKVC